MSKTTPDSTLIAPETATEKTTPVKTGDAIRAALRNKANAEAGRGLGNPYGTDQKPPTPPYGTRRSMGKR